MLRDGNLIEIDSLSEIGIYSTLFINTEKQLFNEPNYDKDDDLIMQNGNFGTLLRTKGSHSNEGGVNAGFSVID